MNKEAERTQVVLMVGGEAKRMGLNIPKALIKVGEITLLERCINMFTSCGFSDFRLLMGYKDQRIEEYLKNVNLGGASITNSYDYAQGIAKGKAIKQALIDGKIDKNKRAFVAFPDDLFLDNKLPERAVVEHANAVNKFGIFASAVVAEAYRYPQGVVYADERGIVTRSEENPLVPLLTTVGMYIFEPPAYKYFLDLIDLKKEGPAEFEVAVMPKLANEGKEYAIKIPPDTWIAINTIKELEKAQRLVESGAIPKR